MASQEHTGPVDAAGLEPSWLCAPPPVTPTVALPDAATGCTIWLKCDHLLPSGSTKDRLAQAILSDAVQRGAVHPGDLVVEASSGSTSIALAMTAASLGLRFRAYLPEGVSAERGLIIRRYGGEVRSTAAAHGMAGAIDAAARAGAGPGTFAVRQFENPLNAAAHEVGTGPEVLRAVGGRIDGFVAGVGTGGTLMGVARALRAAGQPAVMARAVPGTAQCVGGGPEVCGGVPGIVEGFSRIFDPDEIDCVDIHVPDDEVLSTTRELARRGFGVGPSSGLNLAAARRLAARLGPGHHVATILCDRMERYFSTALFDDVRESPASPAAT